MAASDEAQLIEAIYDATLDPAVLDDVLGRMRARLRASISYMFADDAKAPAQWHLHGLDAAVLVPYAEHYHRIDDFKHALITRRLLRSGTVFMGERIVDRPALRCSAFVNEFLRPNDFGPHCGSSVHVTSDGLVAQLSFFRPVGAQDFGDGDLEFFKKLVPHFGRAARLRLRIEQHARPPAWTLELLDGLPWGVILLDREQRAVVVNREAERILGAADGLRLDRRGLFADHPEDSHRLRTALGRATARCNGHAGPGADLQLTRPSGAPALLVTIVPLGRRVLDLMGTSTLHAALHIVDPATRPVVPAERLRSFFGLTPAEAALASALAAGRTLQEYADEAQVTSETARWRLKQVLAKTDTRRQAELVRLLLASAVLG
jgi:DNA-binding CsgD family transcriptional regulator/PAS domain-containing protein